MKLTRTNRIIMTVAGVIILLMLLFPPVVRGVSRVKRAFLLLLYVKEPVQFEWKRSEGDIVNIIDLPLRIDGAQLATKVALVVVAAGMVMLLLHKTAKPKQNKDA